MNTTHEMAAMKHVMAWKLAMTVNIEEKVNESVPTTMTASVGSKATKLFIYFYFFWKVKTTQESMPIPAGYVSHMQQTWALRQTMPSKENRERPL